MSISARSLLLALGTALAMAAGPALADPMDEPVSRGGRSSDRATAEVAPSPVPAGEPFAGMASVSAADIVASGARLVREASGPDPLSDMVAEMLAEGAPESLIGWDSRMRQYTSLYPNRAIVYISYGGGHLCTGFLVSRSLVATSGHCVHTGGTNGNWRTARLFEVFPGRDGTSSPYGSCGVTQLHSVVGWTRNGDSRYDYGALRLNCTIGNTVGWFGLYATGGTRYFRNRAAIVSGYPGDKPQTQWLSADEVHQSENLRVCYRADTVGGHSGSPVWNDRENGTYADGAWAFAIHGYGVGGGVCGSSMNWGVRMNAARIRNYNNWIAAAP